MTSPNARRTRARGSRQRGAWPLQDAKARFSELVRKVKSEGPQRVTLHGRDEVVVVSAQEYRRLTGEPTGNALVDVLRSCPVAELDMLHEPTRAPVRGVAL